LPTVGAVFCVTLQATGEMSSTSVLTELFAAGSHPDPSRSPVPQLLSMTKL